MCLRLERRRYKPGRRNFIGPAPPRRSRSYCKFIRLGLLPRHFQMVDPWRWMATQAIIFLPTLIGSTRQYMMKGVPSFL